MFFLKNFRCKVVFAETYLEPSQTSGLFCKNSQQLVAVNH